MSTGGDDLIADDGEWHNLEVARRTLAAGDRAAAIGALTTTLNAGVDEDEALAKAASHREKMTGEQWHTDPDPEGWVNGTGVLRPDGHGLAVAIGSYAADHIARHDPARKLRDVKAGRDLLAAILAEPHAWIPGDEYYSCSQAEDPDPAPGEGGPGSGCSDPDRAGQPCDCGRDARVERLLRILAGAYEEGGR